MPRWLAYGAMAITRLNRRIFLACTWLMAVVVPVMLYEVVARYVFNAPTVWGMELAVLLFGPYFLLGGPYLLHLRGHVALDLVRQRLDERWNRFFDLLNFPVIIAFCLILLVYSLPAAWNSWQYGETSFSAWNPPIWPVKATVPVALALMLLQSIVELLRVVYREEAITGTGIAGSESPADLSSASGLPGASAAANAPPAPSASPASPASSASSARSASTASGARP